MYIGEAKKLLAQGPNAEQLDLLRADNRVSVRKLLLSYEKKQKLRMDEMKRFDALLKYESEYYDQGFNVIAGVDEAGRGPLAGPLVIAAVILPRGIFIDGLDDSKKLSTRKRRKIFCEILAKASDIAVNIVSVSNIDSLNIYRATQQGMVQVLDSLKTKPQIALIDAMPLSLTSMQTRSIIHGDALSASIAAASVVAKVLRDSMMERLGAIFSGYDFAGNKGYGSKEHMAAIESLGATEWHRRSFAPVKHQGLEPAKSVRNIIYYPLSGIYEYAPGE